MLTMDNFNLKYDLYPDVDVLEVPPKIITWSGQTLATVWHRFYINDICKSKHSEYGYAVITFLNWVWEQGPRDIEEVTQIDIEDHIENLEHMNAPREIINIHLCALKRFFEYLCLEKILTRSPLSGAHYGYHIPPKLLVDWSVDRPSGNNSALNRPNIGTYLEQ